MLNFVIGRACRGKTYYTVEKAAECAKRGESPVILVPEQFSFECEKQVLHAMGDNLSQRLAVLSFSRIYDEVTRATGGVCTEPLSDADKLILMKKAVKSVAGELKIFGRNPSSTGLAKKMCETVTEFKMNAVTADDLLLAAESAEESVLKSKLCDTAAIMRAYDAYISERFIDPSDVLTVLYQKLENYKFFEGKTVFIDSFDGFTGQQYKIIDRIMSQCKDITVTLNMSEAYSGEYGIFANIERLKSRLTDMAKSHFVTVGEDVILNVSRYKNESLSKVEEYLCGGEYGKEKTKLSGVTVCRAQTVYDEAEFVARSIRKTVRETGAGYRDFLVCARECEPYSAALKNAMNKNGIPCNTDAKTPLSCTPAAATVLAAADLIKGVTSEKIFKLYKSGLEVFTAEELGTLENYVYIWNIEGNKWFENWNMNPEGFVAGDSDNEETARINELRLRAVSPIEKLRKTCGKTVKENVAAVMTLLETANAAQSYASIRKEYKEKGKTAYADAVRQSYDKVISVFDGMVNALGEDELKAGEFYEALSSAISLESIGSVPQTLDEVMFGSADKIRPSRPEYVFIMGANQGVFPKGVTVSGVFTASDRTALCNMGIDIPDKTVYESVFEDYLVYTNVCCAVKGLFISYSETLHDGSAGEASAFLSELCESFEIKTVSEPCELSCDNLPETVQSAFSDYCKSYEGNRTAAESIYSAVSSNENMAQNLNSINGFKARPVFSVTPENSKRLLGGKIRMSPSKFDDFSRCRFMYFCRDALNIRSLQKTEFDVLQRGTLIHYVLEQAIKTYGKGLSSLNESEISAAVDGFIKEYVDSVAGFNADETPRFKFIIYGMARSLKVVVEHLANEFKNSDFEPVRCELGIGGDDSDIPEIRVPVENMGEIDIFGKVDRLDKYNGYVRIVDYKSGSRKFRLPDILFGQNMQMLIYLYAVCKSEKYGGEPAGILYMPAVRERTDGKTSGKMNGLLNCDGDVVLAMDRSQSGEFIPKQDKRNSETFISTDDFGKIFGYIEKRLKTAGRSIFEGKVDANPVDGIDSPACKYCEFKGICRIEDKDIPRVEPMTNAEVISEIEGWQDNGV